MTDKRPNEFVRNVAAMVTGAALAQAIPLVTSPLLTRLYSPTAYGTYAGFLFVTGILALVGTGRYEAAILLPREEAQAQHILLLSLGLSGLFAGASAAVGAVLWLTGVTFSGRAFNEPIWLLMGPMVAFTSWFQVLNTWQVRRASFRDVSASRVARTLIASGLNLSAGVLDLGHQGLFVGATVAYGAAAAWLLFRIRGDLSAAVRGFDRAILRQVANEHRRFPIFSLPTDGLSMLAQQLPVVFLDTATAGLFLFTQNVVGAPLTFLTNASVDIFRERAAREYREVGEFRVTFQRMAGVLGAAGVPTFAILTVFGPELFALIFGEQWRDAGTIARLLSLMYFLKLLASPLSTAFLIVGRQRSDFALHVYIGLSTVACLELGEHFLPHGPMVLLPYVLNYSFVYLVYLVMAHRFSLGLAPRALPQSEGEA